MIKRRSRKLNEKRGEEEVETWSRSGLNPVILGRGGFPCWGVSWVVCVSCGGVLSRVCGVWCGLVPRPGGLWSVWCGGGRGRCGERQLVCHAHLQHICSALVSSLLKVLLLCLPFTPAPILSFHSFSPTPS